MWKINGIELEAVAVENKWHMQSTIEALAAKGLAFADAEAFAAFIFAEVAKVREAGMKSTDYLSDDQWNRLECA